LAVKPELGQKIFRLKQRPATKPLILMAASFADLLPFIIGTSAQLNIWQEIARKYWPGALTLILPASPKIPQGINPTNLNTIGLRIPDCSVALKILEETGPLATTSANLSGQPPLTNMTAIAATFPDILVLDEQELNPEESISSGLPSTLAQWTDKEWKILRQGSVMIR
jgi:L-threonylcarbamoyladenylate synthase